MADLVERLRGPVREAVSRLIAGAFRRDGERLEEKRPRFSIPARPEEDDDLVLIAALEEAADRIAALEAEASKGERRGLERAAEVAEAAAKDFDNPHNHSLGVASDLMEACSDIASDIRALIPEAPVRERWQQIETAPKNRKILAGYHNPLGNWRTITACYHTHLPWSDEENPEDGSEYAPEGWYEESDTAETIYRTRDDPTHWMPLPPPPQDNREG